MSDQKNTPNPEQFSPEHVSLEDRFAAAHASEKPQIEKEQVVEQVAEQGGEDENKYSKVLSQVESKETEHPSVMQDASVIHQQVDRESQITQLIDLAMTKGVDHAVKVAQKAEDYYVLDQLHDQLREDDRYEALVSQGLIEK